jgi:hypothetical protein
MSRYVAGVITGLAVSLALLLVVSLMAPDLDVRPHPAPVGVWNESDRAVTVRLTGASGSASYDLPPQEARVLVAPTTIGSVSSLDVLDDRCKSVFEFGFGQGEPAFEAGGQIHIRDGLFSGATTRLPAEWTPRIEPGSVCDTAAQAWSE